MKSIIYIIFSLIMLTSCEKVIDLNLNSSSPKLVVEGLISNQPGLFTINLTQTTDFFNPGDIPAVKGALVIVKDDIDQIDTFTEIQDGVYQSNHLLGIEGRTYLLTIVTADKEYKSQSYLPQTIPVDSIKSKKITVPGGPGHMPREIYGIAVFFTDLANVANYYRLKTFINGVENGSYNLLNDKLNDGKSLSFQQGSPEFHKGDTIVMELWSIDDEVYNYYST